MTRDETIAAPPGRLGTIALLGLLLLVACASEPVESPAPAPSQASSQTEPPTRPEPPEVVAARAVVERLQQTLTEIMQRADELGYEGRYQRVEAVARESYDLVSMARWTLGPEAWQQLSPEQRRSWLETFERFHVSSVASVRDRYRGQVYRVLDAQLDEQGRVRVATQLDYPGRNVDLHTDYLLRQVGDSWLIVDVFSPPTVSQVEMRRAEYATVLEQGGFERVLQTMQSRIERRDAP